jgi:Tol biopolymer transport system component
VGIAIAIFADLHGTRLIRSSPQPIDHPAPRMHNGSIGVFGFTGGVRSFTDPKTFFVECQDSCTEVRGADWSPDGTRLAFTATCGGGCASAGDRYHGVRVVNVARGSDDLIVPGEGVGALAWSPDGTLIAYVQGQQIFVTSADGSERRPLFPVPDTPSYPSTPSWSPNGSRVVYSAQDQLFIVGLDGSTPSPLVHGSYPAWSRDGSRIAYLVGCELRVTSPDGTNDISLVNLAEVQPDAAGCDTAVDLKWSPDGTKLAAMVDRNVLSPTIRSSRGVFVVNADGSSARLVSGWSRQNGYWGLTWQPVP